MGCSGLVLDVAHHSALVSSDAFYSVLVFLMSHCSLFSFFLHLDTIIYLSISANCRLTITSRTGAFHLDIALSPSTNTDYMLGWLGLAWSFHLLSSCYSYFFLPFYQLFADAFFEDRCDISTFLQQNRNLHTVSTFSGPNFRIYTQTPPSISSFINRYLLDL